jgi:hypothetical protein
VAARDACRALMRWRTDAWAVLSLERFEFSKIWLGFHFLPDFLKNQDLVEDITGRC